MQLLGDDTRRAIVEHLAQGPSSVGDLARRLPVTRSAVSQHLAALKTAHLVSDAAEGTKRIYRLDPAGIQLLRTYLDHMWASALESFGAAVNTPANPTARTPTRSPRTRKRST
ncbi:MAG TPA: metalloregulator ArsR/SmtB family transcription factor [Acidimicrobiia bacterium]